jgi:hypothetical protein
VVLVHGILFIKNKYSNLVHLIEEDIAPIQLAGPGAGHAKVTYSYVEFQSLPSEPDSEVNKIDERLKKPVV